MTKYYHVAGAQWTIGEPLLCWDHLADLGIERVWKWPDAPEGYDGDVVCLFTNRAEATEFAAETGGTILTITVPDGDDDDLGTFALPWNNSGYISPRLTTVEEGYPAIEQGIPAEWISVEDEA